MDPERILIFSLILLFICFSVSLSMTEVSVTFFDKIRLIHLIEKGNKKALKVRDLLANKSLFITSVLTGQMILKGTTLVLVIYLFAKINSTDVFALSVIVVITFVLLKMVDIISKSITVHHAERISFLFINPIHLYLSSFKKLLKTFKVIGLNQNQTNQSLLFTNEEFDTLISLGLRKNIFTEENKNLLEKVLSHKNDTVNCAMNTHRTSIVGVEVKYSFEKIKDIISSSDFDCFPVYENNTDNIIGLLYREDFLRVSKHSTFNVRDLMKDQSHILFALKTTSCSRLLGLMRKNKIYFAVVLDEYGGTEGIITMDDILTKFT